ncbi:hypothetical protein PHLCEN_2v4661 [Hermanssonia centrifuga]|uniref:Uncharacterized protein n=1 Tax=Hermanssonia centrifuga TaxID=98765 RepID=A0A2R6PMY6_9APHY|nr:hypothetical protein PHLCEN_2v4661 [Hermanssonia centrifuga]
MSDTAIRERVVHILSSTLNGCLREMGYFPGILQLLDELRVENANLTERNGKLHIDNVNLSHLVERQKGYIAQMRHVNGDLDPPLVMLPYSMHHDIRRTSNGALSRQGHTASTSALEEAHEAYPPDPRSHTIISIPSAPLPALSGANASDHARPQDPATDPVTTSVSASPVASSTTAYASPELHFPATPKYNPDTTHVSMTTSDSRIASTSARLEVIDLTADEVDEATSYDVKLENRRSVTRDQTPPLNSIDQEGAFLERETRLPDKNADQSVPELVVPMETETPDHLDRALEVAYQIDDNGSLWCKMCKWRFDRGAVRDAPTDFSSTSREERVKHCREEHPVGWTTILKGKK